MLQKSEFRLCCNAKGLDFIIPDNTNYDASKFIRISSGNLVIRLGNSNKQQFPIKDKV